MLHNELKNEYCLKLNTDKNNLIKILKHLDGKTWINLSKDNLKLDKIKEKCKLVDKKGYRTMIIVEYNC